MLSSSGLPLQQNKRTRYAVLLVHTGGPADGSWCEMWRYLSVKFTVESSSLLKWLWDPVIRLCIAPLHVAKAQQLHESMWIVKGQRPRPSIEKEQRQLQEQKEDGSSVASSDVEERTQTADPTDDDDEESLLALPQRCMPSVYYVTLLAQRVQQMIQGRLSRYPNVAVQVECAFAYQPGSMEAAIQRFHLQGDLSNRSHTASSSVREEHLIVLPLLPQYSPAITPYIYRSTLFSHAVLRNSVTPNVHFLSRYGSNPHYILALERHIRQAFFSSGPPQYLFLVFPMLRRDDVEHRCECFRTFVYLQRVLQKSRSSSRQASPREGYSEEDPSLYDASHQLTARKVPAIMDYWRDNTAMYAQAFPKSRIRLVFLTQQCIREAMNVQQAEHSVRYPTLVTAPTEKFSLQNELVECFHHIADERMSPVTNASGVFHSEDEREACPQTVKVSLFAPGSVVEDAGFKAMSHIMPLMKSLWGEEEVECLPPLNDSRLHSELIMELLSAWIKL